MSNENERQQNSQDKFEIDSNFAYQDFTLFNRKQALNEVAKSRRNRACKALGYHEEQRIDDDSIVTLSIHKDGTATAFISEEISVMDGFRMLKQAVITCIKAEKEKDAKEFDDMWNGGEDTEC